jgi:hypothetical protein
MHLNIILRKMYIPKVLLAFVIFFWASQGKAQTSCNAGGSTWTFFTNCEAGSSFTSAGNYAIDVGQGGSLTINGNVTINGTLTITFTGNTTLLRIMAGFKLKATNVVISNSNPTKVLDVDGTFEVTNNLNFANENIDIDGSSSTGQITAGSITGAANVTCSTEGDCPHINTGSCAPSTGLCAETGIVLPVKISSFTTSIQSHAVELRWVTEMEENFFEFIIQRSSNGINFSDIGLVEGGGRNLFDVHTNYNFTDENPLLGVSYYRLKAVDLDGKFEYFGPKFVKITGEKVFSVHPNPASANKIIFKTNFEPSENDRVIIVDQIGTELFNAPASILDGTIIPDSPFHTGMYLIKYVGQDFESVSRVVIKN